MRILEREKCTRARAVMRLTSILPQLMVGIWIARAAAGCNLYRSTSHPKSSFLSCFIPCTTKLEKNNSTKKMTGRGSKEHIQARRNHVPGHGQHGRMAAWVYRPQLVWLIRCLLRSRSDQPVTGNNQGCLIADSEVLSGHA